MFLSLKELKTFKSKYNNGTLKMKHPPMTIHASFLELTLMILSISKWPKNHQCIMLLKYYIKDFIEMIILRWQIQETKVVWTMVWNSLATNIKLILPLLKKKAFIPIWWKICCFSNANVALGFNQLLFKESIIWLIVPVQFCGGQFQRTRRATTNLTITDNQW